VLLENAVGVDYEFFFPLIVFILTFAKKDKKDTRQAEVKS